MQPALAQEQTTDAELKGLIPDSAVSDPEAWAKALPQLPSSVPNDKPQAEPPAAPQSAPAPQIQAEVPKPDSAMAEDSSFTFPWPDEQFELPTVVALEAEQDLAVTALLDAASPALRESGSLDQISPQLVLSFPANPASFPDRDAFVERFTALSAIKRLAGEGENSAALLAARARTDNDLLVRLLRIAGYYDATVDQTISGIEPGKEAATSSMAVRFDINPGARYRLGEVALGDLAQSGKNYPSLRSAFGLESGDELDNGRIVAGRAALESALGETGYAFAKLGEPELIINHSSATGDLAMPVTTGQPYTFGGITSSLPKFLSSSHLENIARFKRGDPFKRSQIEDLRRAIVATGLVSTVEITPRDVKSPQGNEPGQAALDVTLAKAPLRTLSGAIGYDSGEGFRLEASWEHRNLFPPEGMLRLRGVAGTKEQLAGVTFRRNNFLGLDQVLTVDLYANSVKRDAYVARTANLSVTFEKLTTLIFQKPFVWSMGLEALASREREGDVNGIGSPPQNYYVLALPLRGALDTSDNLLDPTRGFRASLRVSPELSLDEGRKAKYARIQADASAYMPLGKGAVLAGRVRLGTIPGANIQNIAPSRRFYAGGGASVRGYGYQLIGPRNSFNAPSGGRSLSEFSLEARIKTGLLGGAVSLVPFLDAGTIDESTAPKFSGLQYGAGMGFRYQTGFGPIRVDIGTPINKRTGDGTVAVYVSLGQAF